MNTQIIDLLISHHQIHVRSVPYNDDLCVWRDVNIEQGAILHSNYLVFDPLPDDSFGANIKINVADTFQIDSTAQRCISAPFTITHRNDVEVASVSESFKVTVPLSAELYTVYFEVCEGDEIFYKITFVPTTHQHEAIYVIDDILGSEKGTILVKE